MEALGNVLRAIRTRPQPKRDHLTVFREFLTHLDRAGRKTRPHVVKRKRAKQKTKT